MIFIDSIIIMSFLCLCLYFFRVYYRHNFEHQSLLLSIISVIVCSLFESKIIFELMFPTCSISNLFLSDYCFLAISWLLLYCSFIKLHHKVSCGYSFLFDILFTLSLTGFLIFFPFFLVYYFKVFVLF